MVGIEVRHDHESARFMARRGVLVMLLRKTMQYIGEYRTILASTKGCDLFAQLL